MTRAWCWVFSAVATVAMLTAAAVDRPISTVAAGVLALVWLRAAQAPRLPLDETVL